MPIALSSVLAGATVTLLLAHPSLANAGTEVSATAATNRGGFVSVFIEEPSEEQLDALATFGADRLRPYASSPATPGIRALAAYAARLIPDHGAARGLIRSLLNDGSPLVREAAILAAGYHIDEELFSLLRAMADDTAESPGVRATASDVLADLE